MLSIRPTLLLSLAAVVGCDTAPKSEATNEAATPGLAYEARSDAPASAEKASVGRASPSTASPAPEPVAFDDARHAPHGSMDALPDDDGTRRFESPPQPPTPSAGILTAGRWSDRDDWGRWQGLRGPGAIYQSILDPWAMGGDDRVAVTLRGPEYTPVDARIVLEDQHGGTTWSARTDVSGRADLFLPPHRSGRLVVRDAQGNVLATREVNAGETHEIRTNRDLPVAASLDLMFVVDTTGSMGDELSFLQTELTDIVARVERDAAQKLQVRTSVNFFKDQGDDYVVRSFPFTTDIGESLRHLRAEYADGGGDTPEALGEALSDAVRQHQWSDSAVARLMFVVTDAPPHEDGQVGQGLRDSVALAASRGIRIIPIASSGVDKPAEFVLRQMAVSTGGTYVFLTDHSGVGNGHIEPTVGPHTVEPLNDLIVDVIEGYAASTAPVQLTAAAQVYDQGIPCGYAVSARSPRWFGSHDPWWYALVGLALLTPLALAGLWWQRRGRTVAPSTDPRITRARRLVGELSRLAKTTPNSEAQSWSAQVVEVADGIEALAQQREAIDASLRSAGAPLHDSTHGDTTDGMRGSLAAEVARRREAIDTEIDAGLLSIESAYLHVIGGVGQRSTAQANLDAAREALHTRLEVERDLRL